LRRRDRRTHLLRLPVGLVEIGIGRPQQGIGLDDPERLHVGHEAAVVVKGGVVRSRDEAALLMSGRRVPEQHEQVAQESGGARRQDDVPRSDRLQRGIRTHVVIVLRYAVVPAVHGDSIRSVIGWTMNASSAAATAKQQVPRDEVGGGVPRHGHAQEGVVAVRPRVGKGRRARGSRSSSSSSIVRGAAIGCRRRCRCRCNGRCRRHLDELVRDHVQH
jgi:hypothetical protein